MFLSLSNQIQIYLVISSKNSLLSFIPSSYKANSLAARLQSSSTCIPKKMWIQKYYKFDYRFD
jgi:hypothetical protein